MKILVVCLILALGRCWWEVGHMMTSQICQLYLRESERNDVIDWVEKTIHSMDHLTDGRSNSFTEAAVWADDIKEEGTDFLDLWHFTNKPIVQDGFLYEQVQERLIYNSLDAMKRIKMVLTNHRGKQSISKSMMLRYLIHIVGDIHQPLHNTNFYNTTHTTGDLGGNNMKIILLNGTTVNLHSYWDSGAFTLDPTNEAFKRPLSQTANQQLENLSIQLMFQYPSRKFLADSLDFHDPEIWMQESYGQATELIYPFLKNHNKVTEEWHQQSISIIHRNLALGGYRLAETLIDLFELVKDS